MMLNCGAIPVLDHDGRPVSRVNGSFYEVISFTLATFGQRFNVPTHIVGRKGYLVSRATTLNEYKGYSSVHLNMGTDTPLDVIPWENTHWQGEVHNKVFSLNSIPSFFSYYERGIRSTEGNLLNVQDYDINLRCRVELKLYY